jgi:hypothetical protein
VASPAPSKDAILDEIRRVAAQLGKPPSRSEFFSSTEISEHNILTHFPSWRDAVASAGLTPHTANIKLEPSQLLEDWALLVRKHRQIPTRHLYRREGNFSPTTFDKHLGPWSRIPEKFQAYAQHKTDWSDVLALLPPSFPKAVPVSGPSVDSEVLPQLDGVAESVRHTQLSRRAMYGNPIDFRGLRHEPVNEQGVVFLFGMVAKELGYMVEAVQTGYPDCEAKRQVGPNKWQRVRIEFEFESRNFRDHGHACDGCDVIVCWRHNWVGCPPNLEIVELSQIIQSLSRSED